LRTEIESLAARARVTLLKEGIAATDPADASDGNSDATSAPPGVVDPFGLTRRERDVLALLATGRTNRQIAASLFIAESTAGVHVSNILGKLGVDNRVEAAAIAHRLGFGAGAPNPPDAA
jgi:DNA-binding NarL/FixJ family response regulator